MKVLEACAAIVATSALVILSATPASATVHSVTVTGGTLNTLTLGTFDLGPPGIFGPTGPCINYATDTDTIALDETGTGTPTTVYLGSVAITSSLTAGVPAKDYAVVITKNTVLGNTGTITSTGAVTQSITWRIEFMTTTQAPTCIAGTKVCTAQINGTLTGTASSHPLVTSTTAHLAGAAYVTMIPFMTCSAPFATLLTTSITITSLTLHVTT